MSPPSHKPAHARLPHTYTRPFAPNSNRSWLTYTVATLTIEELRTIGISPAIIDIVTGLQRSPFPPSSWTLAKQAGATAAHFDYSLFGVTKTYNPFSTETPTLGRECMQEEDKSVLGLYFKCPCNPKRSIMEITSRAKVWDHTATQQHGKKFKPTSIEAVCGKAEWFFGVPPAAGTQDKVGNHRASSTTATFHVEPSPLAAQSDFGGQDILLRAKQLESQQGGNWQSYAGQFQLTTDNPVEPRHMELDINDDDNDVEDDFDGSDHDLDEKDEDVRFVATGLPALLNYLQTDIKQLNDEAQIELDHIRELAEALQPPEKGPKLKPESALMLLTYRHYLAGDMPREVFDSTISSFWKTLPTKIERTRFMSPSSYMRNCAALLRLASSSPAPSYIDPLNGQTVWYKPLIGVMEMLLADGRVTEGWRSRHDPSSPDKGHPVNRTHWKEAEEYFGITPGTNLLGLSVFIDGLAPRKGNRKNSYYSISIGLTNPCFSAQSLPCSKALVMAIPGDCDLRLAIRTCIVEPLLNLRTQHRGCFIAPWAQGTGLVQNTSFRPFIFAVCGDDPTQREVSGLADWKHVAATRRLLEPSLEQRTQEAEYATKRSDYGNESRDVTRKHQRQKLSQSPNAAPPTSPIPPSRPHPITVAPKNLEERNMERLRDAMTLWQQFRDQPSAAQGQAQTISPQTLHHHFEPMGMKSFRSTKDMSKLAMPVFWDMDEFSKFGNYFLKFGICILHAFNLGIIKWLVTSIGAYLPSGAQSHINSIMTSVQTPAKFRTQLFAHGSTRDNPSVNSATGAWWQSFLFDRIDQVLADYVARLPNNDEKARTEQLFPALQQLRHLTTLLYCDFDEANQGKSFKQLRDEISDMTVKFKHKCEALFLDLGAGVSFEFPNWYNIDAFYHLTDYLGAPRFYNTQRFEAVHFELKRLAHFSSNLALEMTHKSQVLNTDAVSFLIGHSHVNRQMPSCGLALTRVAGTPLPTSLTHTWNTFDKYRRLAASTTGEHRQYGILHSIPKWGERQVVSVSCSNRTIQRLSQCVASFFVDGTVSSYALKDIWTFSVLGENPRTTHVWIELVKVVECSYLLPGLHRNQELFQIQGQEPVHSFLVPDRGLDPTLPDCTYRVDWNSIPPNKLHTIWKPLDELQVVDIEQWRARIYRGGLYWIKSN